MHRWLVVIAFASGCASPSELIEAPEQPMGDESEPTDSADPVEETGPEALLSLDTSAWVMAEAAPPSGTELVHQFTFAGSMSASLDLEGHWTDVYKESDTGRIVCAVTHRMASAQPTLESGCDASWNDVSWDAPIDHGTDFCVEALGVDPMAGSMGGIDGVGWCVIPATLCTLETSAAWQLQDWAGLVERYDDGFLVQHEATYTVP